MQYQLTTILTPQHVIQSPREVDKTVLSSEDGHLGLKYVLMCLFSGIVFGNKHYGIYEIVKYIVVKPLYGES